MWILSLSADILKNSITSKLTGQASPIETLAKVGGSILSPQAKQTFSQVGNDFTASPLWQQVQKAKPLVLQGMDKLGEVGNTLTAPVKPIIEEYQYQGRKQQAKTGLRERLPDLTIDEIEQSGISDEEKQKLLTIYDFAGKEIGWMEKVADMQAQTAEEAWQQDNATRGLSTNPEYEDVNVLWRLASNIPKFQSEADDMAITSVGKMVWNLIPNAIQFGAGIWDIGLSTAYNIGEWPLDTISDVAKAKIINPTYQSARSIGHTAQQGYEKGKETNWKLTDEQQWPGKNLGAFGGVLGSIDALTQKGIEFAVENPVATMWTISWIKNIPRGYGAIKSAGGELAKGNISWAIGGLTKSTAVGVNENILQPIKAGITMPIAGMKLWAKAIGYWMEKIGISGKIPSMKTSQENVPGVTEKGTEFNVEQTPWIVKNITDKVFNKDNEILAQQSVFPKATKEKTPQARLDSAKTALEWIKQLYEDKANGIVQSDIKTMGGGVEWVNEALDYHGSKIGELTKNDAVVDTADLTPKLVEANSWPFSSLNPDMHNLVTKVAEAFSKAGNKADIATIQNALSNIKSEIFGNWANIAKLYKTESGRALNEFLKNLEDRFQKTIEETTGNSAELAQAKEAYARYKKIQKDLTDSYMVELRNQWKWLTGTAGKVAWLYEVLSNPSMSWIFKAILLKQAGETMQYYKSRGWNYETLIRNLDREATQRSLPTKIPKNDSNNSTSSSNLDNSQFWVKNPPSITPPKQEKGMSVPTKSENAPMAQKSTKKANNKKKR